MMHRVNELLLETIDEVINNVFEYETAEVIFQYFKKNSSKKIDDKIKLFIETLPKILGVGSVIIEDLIIENLYSKYNLKIEWKNGNKFMDYIIELQKKIK